MSFWCDDHQNHVALPTTAERIFYTNSVHSPIYIKRIEILLENEYKPFIIYPPTYMQNI